MRLLFGGASFCGTCRGAPGISYRKLQLLLIERHVICIRIMVGLMRRAVVAHASRCGKGWFSTLGTIESVRHS